MGLFKISCGTSYLEDPRNPNPSKFRIDRIEQVGHFVVAKLHYRGCTNYEGNKIIVWRNMPDFMIKQKTAIDPHFTEGNKIVARFVPTEEGWNMAIMFAKAMES